MDKKYEIGIYEKDMPAELTYEEKLLCAKKYGFDFVELSIDETDEKLARLDYPHHKRKSIVETMFKTGCFFRSMCLSGHRKYPLGSQDKKTRERGLDIMKKAVDLAADFGIRIIQLAGYDVYYEKSTKKSIDLFTENLKKAVGMAAAAGILLGFETMETAFMDTVSKAMKYVNMINSAYLGVYPDLGNITNAAGIYKTDVTEDLESGRGHLIAMHLKETVPGKFRGIPFGTGHVNFAAGIKKAWDLGIRRYVTEFWVRDSPEWEKDIQQVNEMIKEILDRQQTVI